MRDDGLGRSGSALAGGDERGDNGQSGCAPRDLKGLVGVAGGDDNGDEGATVFRKKLLVSFAIASIGIENKMN